MVLSFSSEVWLVSWATARFAVALWLDAKVSPDFQAANTGNRCSVAVFRQPVSETKCGLGTGSAAGPETLGSSPRPTPDTLSGMQLSAHEQRVLGCLIEKQRTTPDTYPLSLNALRTACNQSSSRDPVMAMTDDEVREACTGLHRHGLARIAAAGQGSRTTKYRHTAGETLPATQEELALIAVLLLRGPQTRGELRTRTERIHTFATPDDVEEVLGGLGMRGLVLLLDREPGAREARYQHQLGPRDPEVEAAAEEAAAEFRAQLEASGELPVDDESSDGPGPEAAEPEVPRYAAPAAAGAASPTAPPAASAPVQGTPAATTVDLDAILARIAALEQRVDELEDLISS
jgi:uncharacterized protein YceH (UPF0502 family)